MRRTSYLAWALVLVAAGCGNGSIGPAGDAATRADAGDSGAHAADGSNPVPDGSNPAGDAGGPAGDGGACADPTDPVFPNCEFSAEGYRRLAADLGGEAAIAYRYGRDARAYHPTPEDIPTLCEAEHRTVMISPTASMPYELGMHDRRRDDYSATDGQIAAVPEGDSAAGLYHYTSLLMGQGIFAESPQWSWQLGGNPDDIAIGAPNEHNRGGYALNGDAPLRRTVAIGRARGQWAWTIDAVAAFENGVLGTPRSLSTYSRPHIYTRLPDDKRPIAITLTSNNEFALVVVWDTTLLRSQLAVIALGQEDNYWGNWPENYPGLINGGRFTFWKVLGYVDLPLRAATEIAAQTDFAINDLGYAGWYHNAAGANAQLADLPLSVESNRQLFVAGQNAGGYSRAGYAVVISRSERRAVFVDLRPLFAGFERMYFGTRADFDRTRTIGQAPGEWPYAFSAEPGLAPTVAAVIEFDSAPTAVAGNPTTPVCLAPGAWNCPRGPATVPDGFPHVAIATEDGALRFYDVGGLAGRHARAARRGATDVLEVARATVGRNPTGLIFPKHSGTGPGDELGRPETAWIASSRGDRRVDFVYTAQDNRASVVRTLRDGLLTDPIAVEDADNHGTESYVLSVADYGGRRVVNYRYGPVLMWTNRCAPDRWTDGCDRFTARCGGDFERAGVLSTRGRPFAVSVTNTP